MTLKRAGWLTILVSLVVMIGCAVVIGVRIGPAVGDAVNGTSYPTPMNQTLSLAAGDYLIYQSVGGQALDASEVSVTAPGGESVALVMPGTQQEIRRAEASFTARLGFTVRSPGDYHISVRAAAGSSVLVTKNLVNLATGVGGWFGGGFLGFLLLIAGIVMLIVSRSRRRDPVPSYGGWQPIPTPPPNPQPGWYPDPEDRQRWRWWDGSNWGNPQK